MSKFQMSQTINSSSSGDENALEQFYDFYFKESHGDPIPFGKNEKLAVGLELLGSSAGIYYWPSAATYGEDKPIWLKSSLIAGNTIVGTLFLLKATDDLFDAILLESKAPAELRHLVKLPSKKALVEKYVKMVLGSTICSIPFGIATYLFPLPGCESTGCLATIVTHSIVANVILHAISWNVILTPSFWPYRLPLVPVEKAHQFYKDCRMTANQRSLIKCNGDQEKIYQKYRMLLSQFFTTASHKIVNTHLKDSKSNATTYLRGSKEGSLMSLAEAVQDEKGSIAPSRSSSRLWCLCTGAHRLLMKGGIDIAGAAFMLVGCIGWVVDPVYLGLSEGWSIAESLAVGILPAYSMGVLVAFYGAGIFKQVYEYMTSGKSLSDKLPLEAKLYPKTFTLFLLANAYMSVFSYATAQILITTIFGDEMWDNYRPYLQDVAYAGVPVLSFVPFFELFIAFVRKSVAKFGPESDQQMAARLLIKSNMMSQRLQQIKGKELMEGIQRYSPQQQQYLGIDPAEVGADLQTLHGLEEQASALQLAIEEEESAKPSKRFALWPTPEYKKDTPLLINSEVSAASSVVHSSS